MRRGYDISLIIQTTARFTINLLDRKGTTDQHFLILTKVLQLKWNWWWYHIIVSTCLVYIFCTQKLYVYLILCGHASCRTWHWVIIFTELWKVFISLKFFGFSWSGRSNCLKLSLSILLKFSNIFLLESST